MVEPAAALPGRAQAMPVPARHEVLGTPLEGPFPDGVQSAIFGMGCFWGAEQIFWQADGVYTTAVGYAGGLTPNPTYEEVCGGRTGHAEVVLVAFDTAKTSYQEMLRLFWEGHDPTQGMRQGNDLGTQYRSLIWPLRRVPASRRRNLAERLPADALRCRTRRRSRRSSPRSTHSTRSTTPRTTTSSIWPRTPAVTAATAAPGSPVPSASPAEPAPLPSTRSPAGPRLTRRRPPRRARPIRKDAPAREVRFLLTLRRRRAPCWRRAATRERGVRRAWVCRRGRPRCRESRGRRSPALRR